MKVPLRSINYKHYKWYIESDQIFPLRFVVKFGGIRETLLVTRHMRYKNEDYYNGKNIRPNELAYYNETKVPTTISPAHGSM